MFSGDVFPCCGEKTRQLGSGEYVRKACVCGAVAIILFLYVVDVVIQCIRWMKRWCWWNITVIIFPPASPFLHRLHCENNIHNTKKLFYCNRSCIYLFSVHNLFVCVSHIPQRLCVFSGFDVVMHFLLFMVYRCFWKRRKAAWSCMGRLSWCSSCFSSLQSIVMH